MSYILEALKKSENERRREEIPGLGADHSQYSSVRQERKSPLIKQIVVFIVLFSGASCLAWWLIQRGQAVETIEQPLAVVIPSPSLPLSAEVTELVLFEPQTAAQAQTASVVEEAPVIASLPVPEAVGVVSVPDADLVPEDINIPLIEELPEAIRDKIPALTFAGHVYAIERQQRMIMINMRVVREGAMVEPDLILEEIDENGVILRYSEVLFRVDLF